MSKKNNGHQRGKIRKLNDRIHEFRSALSGMVKAVDRALVAEDEQSYTEQEMVAVGLRQAMEAAHKALGGVEWDEWGEWKSWKGEECFPDLNDEARPNHVFRNNLYEVWVRLMPLMGNPDNPMIAELSVKRLDKLPIDYNHWRTIQRIKDEILGINADAAMLYPCAERLQDSANQYRIYAMPQGMYMPFGDHARIVAGLAIGGDDNPRNGPRQRPFEPAEQKADDLAHNPDKMEQVRAQIDELLDSTGATPEEE